MRHPSRPKHRATPAIAGRAISAALACAIALLCGAPAARAATAPVANIISGLAAGTRSSNPNQTFVWSLGAHEATTPRDSIYYAWKIDAGAFTAPSHDSVAVLSGLSEGSHTLTIAARDSIVHLGTQTTRTFIIDLTPPNTSFTGGPADSAWSNVPSATFTFSATDTPIPVAVTYSWRVDGGAWSTPSGTSSAVVPVLPDGTHVFEVKAIDAAGNEDPTPATRGYKKDTARPSVTILQPANGATIAFDSVTVVCLGADNLTTTPLLAYSYSLDGTSYSTPVTNQTAKTFGPLALGTHTVDVRVTDLATNVVNPAPRVTFTTTVVAPAATIVSGLANNGRGSNPNQTFVWTLGTHTASTPRDSVFYAWQLDGGAFTALSHDTTAVLSGLIEGSHTLTIAARDTIVHLGTELTRTFIIDQTPPNTTITGGPADSAWSASLNASFSFSGTDTPAPVSLQFSWRVDGGAWSTPSTNTNASVPTLPDGEHVFEVKAIDGAGNEDPTPATRGYKKDTAKPTLTFLQPAEGATINVDTLTVVWLGSDNLTPTPLLKYQYSLDGAGFTGPVTNQTARSFGPLSAGAHNVRVAVTDLATNANVSPYPTLTFNIDINIAPVASITSGLASNARSNNPNQTFVWTLGAHTPSSPPDSIYYAWKLDAGGFTALSHDTVAVLSGLAEGSHTLTIAARDSVVHLGSQTTRTFIIDQTPPNTSITTGPADSSWSNVSNATFTLVATDTPAPVVVTYSWRVDGGAWSAPSTLTTATMPALADGAHVLEAKAIDGAGNEDPTPVTRGYKKDTTRPTVTILQPANGAIINADSLTVVCLGADNLTPTPLLAYAYSLDGGTYSTPVTNETARTFGPLSLGTHTVDVRATDLATNVTTAIPRVTFTTSAVAPAVTIVSGLTSGARSNNPNQTFVWTLGTHTASTPRDSIYYAWKLDGGAFAALSHDTTAVLNGLTEGSHNLTIAARDTIVHLGTELVRNFIIDQTAPNTTIAGGPADSSWSNAASAAFSYNGTDTPAPVSLQFSWRVDGGAWSAPSSATTANLPTLPDGGHVFEVKAIDLAGNEDPTPASRGYKKDTTLPTAVFLQPADGATIDTDTLTVIWLGSDNLTTTPLLKYQYSLDGAGFSTPVTNQTARSFGPLSVGGHNVRVIVTDLTNNAIISPYPTVTFTINSDIAPVATILSGPANGAHTNNPNPSFVWTLGAHTASTPHDSIYYAWTLGGGAFTALSRDTVANLAGLSEGTHTFTIAARDTVTHLGTQTVRTFTVDVTAPNASVTNGPANGGWTNSSSVLFNWSGTDNLTAVGQLKFSFRTDGGAFSVPATGGGTTLNGLAAGAHSFEVRAEDLAGNVDPTSDSRSFTVDLVAPETQLLSGPLEGEVLTTSSAAFGWTGSDDFTGLPQLRFASRLDAESYPGPSSATSVTRTSLADGPHTFYVRATDLANNSDGSPASRGFVVDVLPPTISVLTGPAANACIGSTSTGFTWSATDVVTAAGAIEFAYVLDGAPATAFATGLTGASLSGLAEGTHSLVIQARDEHAHVASLTRPFTVDLTAPLVNVPTTGLFDASRVRVTCTGSDAASLTGFHVQVSLTPTFSVIALDTVTAVPGVFDYTGIPGSTYYARAAAIDCAGNQSAFSAASNGTTITNLPDLTVTQVLVPGSAILGQVIPVTFTVTNSALGATNAPQWYDDVYLSPTPVFNVGTATQLKHVLNLTSLGAGESYTVNTNVTLPLGSTGNQYVLVIADNTGLVPETNGTNNAQASPVLPIAVGDVADLHVQQVVAPPTALAGEVVTVQWTVKNDGSGRTNTDNWWDTVLFSNDSDFDYAVLAGSNLQVLDLPVGTFQHVGALDPGQSYTRSVSVTVPTSASGTRYFLVVSDLKATVPNQSVPERGSVFEDLSEINAGAADSTEVVQQAPPDLVAESLTAPANANSGALIPLSWQVRNIGFNPTPNQSWTDRLWLSSDATLDAGDLLLKSVARSGVLALNAAYTGNTSISLPNGISGSYYLLVTCDALNQLVEYVETNNSVGAAPPTAIALSPWPNLVPFSGDAPDTAIAGGASTVSWNVQNTGTREAAGAWYDEVLFSTASTIGGATPRVMATQRVTPNIFPGNSYGAAASFSIPTSFSGTYYVYLRTDTYNTVFEHTDEGDNTELIGTVFVKPYPSVDLSVAAPIVPASANSGEPLAASFTVTNLGQGKTIASAWGEEVWLSSDATLQIAGDLRLTAPGHGGVLAAGASYTRSYTPTIPNGTGGSYYVIVRTDPTAASGDGNLANNIAVSAAPVVITAVPPADVTVTVVTTAASDTSGQPIHVDYTVRNNGPGTIAGKTWYAASYLSRDPLLDGGDVLLGSAVGPVTLNPAATSAEGMDVTLPGWASGAYYLIVAADSRNDIWEGSSEGNNHQITPITVILPPPADLIVGSVTAPATGVSGEDLSVTFTITNQGANPASGTLQNAVHVSSDDTFQSESDPLVAIQNMTVNLPPGASQTFVQSFDLKHPLEVDQAGNVTGTLPPVSIGNYHAIVRTNVRANIRELDLANNDAASATTIATDMAALILETPTATTLTADQSRFYRVTVPAGQDLTFSLGSNLVGATNEMFVAFNRAPNPGDYDFSGPAAYTAAPKVLVPGTQAGTYYVMVLARNLGVGQTIENVSVLARLLPFQLTAVTPAVGGHGGRVTCTLTGAGLRDTTVIRLEQSGIPKATATLSRYINSTELLARFDLTGVPEGLYDVVAVNGAESVSLPNAFTVETPRPMAVDIKGTYPDVLRKNATGAFQLRFTNPSNQDVPVLKARVLFPATSILRSIETTDGLLSSSERFPALVPALSGDVSVLHKADGTDSLAAVDLIGGNLAPGETRTVTLGLSGFETSPYSVRALASALPLNEFLEREISANETARQAIMATTDPVPAALVALAGDPFAYRDDALVRGVAIPGIASVSEVQDYLFGLPSGAVPPAVIMGPAAPQSLLNELALGGPCVVAAAVPDCTPEVASVATALPACLSAVDIADLPIVIASGGGYAAHVPTGSTRGFDVTTTADARVVAPCDPNIITGPAGFGDQRWVNANDAMSYRVDFENLAGVATAPAQVVKVTLPLDADLDITSFRLSDFGFGPNLLTVPTDRTSYSIEPFFASLGLRVRITAGLDLAKHEAFWTFTSIDPATGQQPTNPYVGFLPVNSVTGNGTGFVTFTIRALGSATSGTAVLEQASIKFDANAPYLTVQAANKLDTRLPVSAVSPTVTLLDTTRARLAWTSADDSSGAGLQKVALWQKRDSGPFTLYQDGLTVNQLDVPVEKGHTFAFYTLATDNTGNAEPNKTVADATVTVGLPGYAVEPSQVPVANALHQNFPNPFSAGTTLRFDLARDAEATIEIYDIQGRLVSRPVNHKLLPAGPHTVEAGALPRGTGVYFYRLKVGDFEQTRRMVRLK